MFLWFEIIVLILQDCIVQGPNTLEGKGISTPDNAMEKTNSFRQPADKAQFVT
jgi:hypothetical protein